MRAYRLLALLALGMLALSDAWGGEANAANPNQAICRRSFSLAPTLPSLLRQANGHIHHELKLGDIFPGQNFFRFRDFLSVDAARPRSIAVSMPIPRSPPA